MNPATVAPVITNSLLTATGTDRGVFAGYTVTATHGLTFSALGLPPGLTINAGNGRHHGHADSERHVQRHDHGDEYVWGVDTKTLVITIAPGAVTFKGIGDLAGGGVGSAVRDATRVGGVIYAVGSSTSADTLPVPNLDTPALWTWPGSGAGTLSALPAGVTLNNPPGNSLSAYAITPSAAFIASQAHYTDGDPGSNWVRVDRSQLPAASANLNLNLGTGAAAFAALAISDNGATAYGQKTAGSARVAVRYELGVGVNLPPLPAGMPAGTSWTFPIPRGTSADGLVMVGVASPAQFGGSGGFPLATNTTAFRYVHNAGLLTGTTTAIPPLVTGGWNFPIALSADGNVTLVAGNSATAPNGEVYLYNASANTTTALGSPNTAWTPRLLGGMTADGVAAVTFASSPTAGPAGIAGLGLPTSGKYAYLHNSHGWFHLSSALAAQGIDLQARALGFDEPRDYRHPDGRTVSTWSLGRADAGPLRATRTRTRRWKDSWRNSRPDSSRTSTYRRCPRPICPSSASGASAGRKRRPPWRWRSWPMARMSTSRRAASRSAGTPGRAMAGRSRLPP